MVTDRPPSRPELPPLLSFALAFWVGCAASYLALRSVSAGRCLAVFCVGAVVAIVFMLAYWRLRAKADAKRSASSAMPASWESFEGGRRGRRTGTAGEFDGHPCRAKAPYDALLLLASGVACGLMWAGAGAMLLHAQQDQVPSAEIVEFRAISDASDYGFGPCADAVVVNGECQGMKVKLMLSEDVRAPLYGDRIEGSVSWRTPAASSRERMWSDGMAWQASLSTCEVSSPKGLLAPVLHLRAQALELLSTTSSEGAQEATQLVQALVCGYRVGLSGSSLYEAFKAAGLAHVVAVSGAHLSIVSMVVGAALRQLRFRRNLLIVVQVAFLVSYLAFTGCSASSVRAAVMAATALLSFFARRRGAALSAIGAAVIAFILLETENAVSVSFALSALSTLSIVLFTPLLGYRLRLVARRIPRWVADPLCVTFASWVLTAAFSAALFSQTSLISPLANIIAAPALPLLCISGSLCCGVSCILPLAAGPLMTAACFPADLFCRIVKALAAVPYASVPANGNPAIFLMLSAVGAVLLWVWWPVKPLQRGRRLALGGLAAALLALMLLGFVRDDQVVMLDVGQGDSLLVQSQGAAILIDTGTNDSLLREALARQGILHLDAVVITHGDDDHMGSLENLASVVEIDRVLVSSFALSCPCDSCARLCEAAQKAAGADALIGLSAGDKIQVGNFSMQVVWPHAFTDEGGNADSLCLLARHECSGSTRAASILFTGDAEAEQLQALLDEGAVGDIDILKVGHHGSKVSVNEAVLDSLKPEVALVSVGEGNRYGHPSEECLQALEDARAEIFRTDLQGDVSCSFKNDGSLRIAVG